MKERVMIIKRKGGIKIKLRREQHQEHKSREKTSAEQRILAVFPCSKGMKNLKFCLSRLESSLVLTFKYCFPPSPPTLLHTQKESDSTRGN